MNTAQTVSFDSSTDLGSSARSFAVLHAEIHAIADAHAKGVAFEKVVAHWLRHDPRFVGVVEQVWLWDDWPQRPGPDNGIDIVVSTTTGELWAVQAKAYSSSSIGLADTATFLAQSDRKAQFSRRLLVTTSERLSDHLKSAIADSSIATEAHTYGSLNRANFPWPTLAAILAEHENPTPVRAPQPVELTPRSYQKQALAEISEAYLRHDRVTVVMPCGTGKTAVGMWHAAESLSEDGVAVVMLPSLGLMSQTAAFWHAHCAVPFTSLPVCSDSTIKTRGAGASTDDDIAPEELSDLGVTGATTDPQQVSAWLSATNGRRVIFTTYHSAPVVLEALTARGMRAELLIADEAHRCAGAPSGGHELATSALFPTRRRLFMTATPRVANRSSNGTSLSMADRSLFGRWVCPIDYATAVESGYLVDWELVVVRVDTAEAYEAVRAGQVHHLGDRPVDAASAALAAAVIDAVRTYELGAVVTYHHSIKRSQAFSRVLRDAAAVLDPEGLGAPISAHAIAGRDPAPVRRARLADLAVAGPRRVEILSNVRVLSEGIDVPGLDAIVFADPRSSVVEIAQALGRVMRPAPGKLVGRVIVPVIADADTDVRALIDQGVFAPVVRVLRALRSHDALLAEDLDAAAQAQAAGREMGVCAQLHDDAPRGRSGSPRTVRALHEKILLSGFPVADAEFLTSFSAHVVDETAGSFPEMLGALERFAAANPGIRAVPTAHVDPVTGVPLGRRVGQLRTQRRQNLLSTAQVKRVEKALPGFVWEVYQGSVQREWDARCAELEQVYREGGVNAPLSATLSGWANAQRSAARKGKLPAERVAKLTAIGFVFDVRVGRRFDKVRWLQKYSLYLVDYTPGSLTREEESDRTRWLAHQRRAVKDGTLEQECVALLRAADFDEFPPRGGRRNDTAWLGSLHKAQAAQAADGHLRNADKATKSWFKRQLGALRANKLSTERVRLLESSGLDLAPARGRPVAVAA